MTELPAVVRNGRFEARVKALESQYGSLAQRFVQVLADMHDIYDQQLRLQVAMAQLQLASGVLDEFPVSPRREH